MGSTTTIRLTARAKRELESLRKDLAVRENRKVTQQEAAERAFEAAREHPELLTADEWKPTQAQRAFMHAVVGVVADATLNSADVDDILYGRRE